MARVVWHPPSLYQALKAEGFELPKNCGDIELEMPVDGFFTLRYRQRLDADDLEKFGRALARMASQHDVKHEGPDS